MKVLMRNRFFVAMRVPGRAGWRIRRGASRSGDGPWRRKLLICAGNTRIVVGS